jgi:hypothetical protein
MHLFTEIPLKFTVDVKSYNRLIDNDKRIR